LHLAARTQGKVLLVKDVRSWPDSTVVSYGVWTDSAGRPMLAYWSPSSESGDWFNQYIYYFDTVGATIAFERRSSFFNGCEAGGAREQSVTYLGGGQHVLRRDYQLTGFDDTTRFDPKTCEFYYRHEYVIYSSWQQLADSMGLSRLYSAGWR